MAGFVGLLRRGSKEAEGTNLIYKPALERGVSHLDSVLGAIEWILAADLRAELPSDRENQGRKGKVHEVSARPGQVTYPAECLCERKLSSRREEYERRFYLHDVIEIIHEFRQPHTSLVIAGSVVTTDMTRSVLTSP